MNSLSKIISIIFFAIYFLHAQEMGKIFPDQFFSFGPTLQWTWSPKCKGSASIGFEISYWKANGKIPYSIDLGIEKIFNAPIVYLYSEVQTTGLSGGPVFEFNSDSLNIGLQGALWLGAFLFADFRIRYLDKEFYGGGGLMLKGWKEM